MWQPYLTGITVTIEAPQDADPDVVLQMAEKKLEQGNTPVVTKGKPIYMGSDQWLVGCTDYPIGPPINCLLKETAMKVAERKTKERYLGGDLILEEILF